jgi:hypothetical protein
MISQLTLVSLVPQDRVQHDAVAVKAYGWKEEHALPPAPHM